MADKVLLIGSGSREHAIALKLAESKHVGQILVAPGNGGTAGTTVTKIRNLKLNINSNDDILTWCKENKPNLVVVGPEDPLDRGIVDALISQEINAFGPTKAAAQIECDKAFAKNFMQKHKIPTAEFRVFSKAEEALAFLDKPDFENPLVVKASGLALGKGVVVASNVEEAKQAVKDMLVNKEFGKASETIVIEEFLAGDEFSVLAFSDGESIKLLPTAQDHKRAYFKDQGPNTGGMGAICPFPLLSDDQIESIKKDIIQKTIDGMKDDKLPFVGVLFAGLMLTDKGIKVLEFNCRFGDPETQTILPMLKSDLYEVMLSCCKGHFKNGKIACNSVDNLINLKNYQVTSRNECAVSVVVASGGYPKSSIKHQPIYGLDRVLACSNEDINISIYHAATYLKEGVYYTNGGRLFSVVASGGSDLQQLSEQVQKAVKHVK